MIDKKTQVLITSVQKLLRRGADHNIRRIMSKTHEADIAVLLESFEINERIHLFYLEESEEKRASILSYLGKSTQKEMLKHLPKNEILQLVSLMESDDAADLLGCLSEEEAQGILSSMVKEDSEGVADLMGYPEDSAGGLMSSEYLSLGEDLTVSEAIAEVQNEENESKVAFYIYVIDKMGRLIGVLSLKQLLLSKKSKRLKDIMIVEVVSVPIEADQEQVARVVERYDFLSLPVVGDQGKLSGIITVDDVIDVIRREAEEGLLQMGQAGWGVNVSIGELLKARWPWVLVAFFGGSICFAIVYLFKFIKDPQSPTPPLWLIAAFTPMLLSLGSTIGGQAATMAVGTIRSNSNNLDALKWYSHLKKELQLGFVFAIILAGLMWLLGQLLFHEYNLSHIFALTTLCQTLLAICLGSCIPFFFRRIGVDPTISSLPLFTILSDLAAVVLLLSFFSRMIGF